MQEGYAPRVLMYCHDGFGLGHLRRTATIADQLVKAQPDCSVLIITGCPVVMFVTPGKNVDYVKLPSIRKVADGQWEAWAIRVEPDEIASQRAAIIEAAALHFRPDVVVVDYMPVGPGGELLPALRRLRAEQPATRFVLGLRDVLDAPHVTRRHWMEDSVYPLLDELYDRILVYGSPDVFDTVHVYGLPAAKCRYTGYVCVSQASDDPVEVRKWLDLPHGRFVLAMGGGGADAFPVLDTYIQAVRRLGKVDFDSLVVAGPLMEPEQQQALTDAVEGLPIRVVSSIENSHDFIAAADAVVSMAGYNSLVELMAHRRPAIIIPRLGPSAEQSTRARLLAERGLISVIDRQELTPERLAATLTKTLRDRPAFPAEQLPPLAGHEAAADEILQLAEQALADRERVSEPVSSARSSAR